MRVQCDGAGAWATQEEIPSQDRSTVAREFETDEEIEVWADSLDERWPERLKVRRHIVSLIQGHSAPNPSIVELCSGDGRLSKEVLAMRPEVSYVGVDASESLLEYFERMLRGAEVRGVPADLRKPTALLDAGSADVIVTLQSMHDVGGPEEISNIYATCFDWLRPKGMLFVSDFVVPEGEVDPKQPGRLPIGWHLGALSAAGYSDARCSMEVGKLGCFVGVKKS